PVRAASSPPPEPGHRWRRPFRRRATLAAGVLAALVVFSFHIFPVYYTAIQAIRRVTEYPLGMPFWAFHPDWGPVLQEIQDPVLLLWLRNTLIVFGTVLVVGLCCSMMAGYGLARFGPPGARWAARLMFCLYFVPQMAVIIPLYKIYSALGLDNTLAGMILIYLTMAVPFATWLFYSYFLGLDRDVEEHAWLDGSRFRVFVHIVLPMAWPIVIAAALFSVGIMGSDVLYGSLFSLTNSTKTITVGLGISSLDLGEWGSASAGIIISALPFIVACALLGRYFVHGLRAALVEGA
ncbi:MAG: carbohydrate ABC transporter permease, partial [Candidatus Dormibacteraeota bacterium]|nr:carbohydrate ABC transporter permease [Candidatus Dormibacteraeota bacterium]